MFCSQKEVLANTYLLNDEVLNYTVLSFREAIRADMFQRSQWGLDSINVQSLHTVVCLQFYTCDGPCVFVYMSSRSAGLLNGSGPVHVVVERH